LTSQEGNSPHVLLDQVLRVPSGDERQEQDQVHLGGELQRRAGEQCQGESGGRLPNCPRDALGILRPIERRADHDPRCTGLTRRARHLRRLGRRGAARVHEHQQTGTPLEQSVHGSLPAMRSASAASPAASGCARARPSLAGSPAPAEAKCGRPPPLPPDTATMALAMSPAFTPCCTRSSVTATCTPACSPFVNRTEIARLWLERNTSITRPI